MSQQNNGSLEQGWKHNYEIKLNNIVKEKFVSSYLEDGWGYPDSVNYKADIFRLCVIAVFSALYKSARGIAADEAFKLMNKYKDF